MKQTLQVVRSLLQMKGNLEKHRVAKAHQPLLTPKILKQLKPQPHLLLKVHLSLQVLQIMLEQVVKLRQEIEDLIKVLKLVRLEIQVWLVLLLVQMKGHLLKLHQALLRLQTLNNRPPQLLGRFQILHRMLLKA